MTHIATVGSIVIKLLKMIINIIVLVLYRTGYGGFFLGVGGTWNLNEIKDPSTEMVASGVFVGFIIYTGVSLVSYCFATGDHKNTFVDILMNIVGIFMWLAIGAVALHYWHGYLSEQRFIYVSAERQVNFLYIISAYCILKLFFFQTGLAMGSLCVINGALYLLDSVLASAHYFKKQMMTEEE
ncbi:protein snakeskin [Holotrichia oblita]|uniref:Protein snakeskin n=1 Tax=Holotrichia oblita TaxID=644536 RepID=A0ACB9SQ42_HOLOL|nr:protein snakeskin [Holotrichia oblita]